MMEPGGEGKASCKSEDELKKDEGVCVSVCLSICGETEYSLLRADRGGCQRDSSESSLHQGAGRKFHVTGFGPSKHT